jgi:hypothetical protein
MKNMIMKNKNPFIIFKLMIVVFLLNGCKKFVAIPPPTTEITAATVFGNTGTVTAALTGIYTQMYNNAESWEMAQNQGLLSDELTSYSTSAGQEHLYTNGMLVSDNLGEWYNAYYYTYEANAIIAGLEANDNISQAVNQEVTGEAKFIRAFWLFYLTNLYGAIPLVTTTSYSTNGSISRSPVNAIYSQVKQDLIDAESLLNSNYVDQTDTAITTERTRPTRAAAAALLARVYLYNQNWDSAEQQATLVINNNLYALGGLGGIVDSVFLKNSIEAIWQLATPLPTNFNTYDAQNFTLTAAPSTGSQNSTTISPELLNAFESGDLRKSKWIGIYTTPSPSIPYYYPHKYYVINSSTVTEYTMVLRLAEQYLIRAEAEAHLGHMSDAAKDLNMVRARAGLGPSPTLTASASLQQADSAILHERQVELFTEWGHRWFDLIRMGAVDSVMGAPGNVCISKGGIWNVNDVLYPVPEVEINSDPKLTQNPGY